MDDKIDKFEELSKALASGVSRRQALKIFGASIAGAIVAPWAAENAQAKGPSPNTHPGGTKPPKPPKPPKVSCKSICMPTKGMKNKACMTACKQCQKSHGTFCPPGLCCPAGNTCGTVSSTVVCIP